MRRRKSGTNRNGAPEIRRDWSGGRTERFSVGLVRFPRPAGMPDSGDPGLHPEATGPPARSWLTVHASNALALPKAWPGIERMNIRQSR